MKQSAGFTLVEFIIVLVMIGTLSLVAVSIYKSRVTKNETLKVDSYEDIQSREMSLKGTLKDCSGLKEKGILSAAVGVVNEK
ncbi:MAG: prepilin-type N-terminal cleavage/methylation domain-containing protein [Endomicrobium sp.]|jgi:prepilin-type N-terminal cleavage/methylation domain-containing protein|nr:prepilin-type N-terminal cleavage/methylation domain-containing protein [Endomicrobium sp.]